MGIYRGAGGTGDATTDSSSEAILVQQLATEAQASADAAATSETNAATSASTASTAATNAQTAETNAETAETNAETAAASASSSASAASTSATNAANSATAAQTAETNAETAETNAETAETNAETAAALAQDWATKLSTPVSGSDYSAKYNANLAAASATAAAGSATTASTAADAALAALDSFDDRYLGQKSSDPTLDNDGNALAAGALYFNTVSNTMKVYDGSSWLAAYASLSGALLATNNLSDVDNAATARSNLAVSGTAVSNTFSANQIISVTDNTNAALRITQLGTGNALLVEDAANPDSTPVVIDANGGVVVGNTTVTALGYTSVPRFQVAGTSIGTTALTSVFAGTSGAFSGSTIFARATGTLASPTAVISGDDLGRIQFEGHDGTAFIPAASIISEVDGTPSTNDMPGRLVFSTTADGASSPTERMRINSLGNVGIGSTAITNTSLRLGNNITGSTASYGIYQSGVIQPDVTGGAYYNIVSAGTASNGGTPYTIAQLWGYYVSQGTYNADSTVTSQYAYSIGSSFTGATNNYGFQSNITAATGRWNFYASGTAQNYMAGNLGLGAATPSTKLEISGNLTQAASGTASTISGTTLTVGGTVAGTWAVGQRIWGSGVEPNTFITALGTGTGGAGTYTVSNTQEVTSTTIYGVDPATNALRITDTDTSVTVNQPIGALEFYGNDASATAGVKAYVAALSLDGNQNTGLVFGTASATTNTQAIQRMKISSTGTIAIGGDTSGAVSLYLRKNMTGATTSYGIYNIGTIQPDATSSGYYNGTSVNTAANGGVPYTITGIYHYSAQQGTFNADSTVTTQYGFVAQSGLIGATNNYGFYGNIASATGRWNLYMNGTAPNYFAGSLLVNKATAQSTANQIETHSTGSATSYAVGIYNWSSSTGLPVLNFSRSKSGTAGTQGVVASGDNIGLVAFNGDDGTNFIRAAYISAQVDGTPGTNDMPGRLIFATTADGASSSTERMRIDSSGNVGIGTSTALARLTSLGGSSTVTNSVSTRNPVASFRGANDNNRLDVLVDNSGATSIMGLSAWNAAGATTAMTFYTGTTGAEAMRIDTNANLQFNSGYGSVATAYGCRAWVNFNGTGTVAIRASGNVSSITDNGTGDYTVNFTNAMPDANYAIAGYSRSTQSANTTSCISGTSNASVSTSACRFLNLELNTSGSHNYGFDADFINVAFFR